MKRSRTRWHSDKAIEKAKEALRKKMRQNLNLAESDKPSVKLKQLTSIHVIRECDLRATLEEKALSCNAYAGWTAFVNRAGTLVHVLPQEGDFHVRIPLYFAVAKMSDKAVERLLQQVINGRLA